MGEQAFIAISGGFDPLHQGHVNMINDAAAFGRVLILLNSDSWLKRKKKYCLMPFEQRKFILENLRSVHVVLPAMDDDDTVKESLKRLKGDIKYFGKGGDRGPHNTAESELCEEQGITVIYGLGGHLPLHSSELVKNVRS